MSHRPTKVSLQAKSPEFNDHCGRLILYASLRKVEHMLIETVLLVAFGVIVGVAIVKAYEWHQDVLYGPYLKARRLKQRPR